MPSVELPQIPHYAPAPDTSENLEFADLTIIDLSKAHTPEGRAELALQVRDAMTTQGFFYAINHGITPAQNARIFDIADTPFSQVPDEEKKPYVADIRGTGSYQGYKLRQFWLIDSGVRDQIEHYNLLRDVSRRQHPRALVPLLPEIDTFVRFNHVEVLLPLLRLFALGLELPEDTFVHSHNFDAEGETFVRFMKYDVHSSLVYDSFPRSEDEETKTKNVWLKGHTDWSSVTIMWSQPVAALQILSPDGKWRWIRHIENALVINAGDAMEFLSGGFYKATIHRVVQPPADQRGYTRLGVFYFAMPDDDVQLGPCIESPVLRRHGIRRVFEDADAPTMRAWRIGRCSSYGERQLKKAENGIEEQIVHGVVVKHYN